MLQIFEVLDLIDALKQDFTKSFINYGHAKTLNQINKLYIRLAIILEEIVKLNQAFYDLFFTTKDLKEKNIALKVEPKIWQEIKLMRIKLGLI
jgi:hypothetical protein